MILQAIAGKDQVLERLKVYEATNETLQQCIHNALAEQKRRQEKGEGPTKTRD